MPDEIQLINASPTKEFFIDMIVRDIPLKMSILDLVDNSIDSTYTKAGSNNLSGLKINITCLQNKFENV